MRICFLTSNYPNESNIYAHGFVHQRAKGFLTYNEDVEVFVPSKTKSSYVFEGVKVNLLPADQIVKQLKKSDILYFHLLMIYPSRILSGWPIYKWFLNSKNKGFFYIHGSEVQTLSSRPFDFDGSLKSRVVDFYKKVFFLPRIKRVIKKVEDVGMIFSPSVWMVNEANTQLNLNIKNYRIIPNGIDTERLEFSPAYGNKFKIACIRPLSSNKYAVDQSIIFLSKLPTDFTLDIYGDGYLKKSLQRLCEELNVADRVTFIGRYIPASKLSDTLSGYGVVLATTRMDAQGVLMCEALACGKIVITTNNTAIPEFVENNVNGFCISYIDRTVEDFIKLINSEEMFLCMAKKARESMERISQSTTIRKELEYITGVLYEE